VIQSLVAFFYGNRFFLRKMGHFGTSKASYMHIKSIISFAYFSFLSIAIPLIKKSLSGKSSFLCVSRPVFSSHVDIFC
jgi:hypothetical protein